MQKKWTAKEVERILLIAQDVISLNLPIKQDNPDEGELGYYVEDPSPGPEERLLIAEREDNLLACLDKYLKPNEQKVIRMRFGFETKYPMTLEEIGKQLNITRERVRQIEARALRTLRYRLTKMEVND